MSGMMQAPMIHEIPERSGDAFRLARGEILTVIDPAASKSPICSPSRRTIWMR